MIITIDPYYDILTYNKTLEALKNNKVDYWEYIMLKPPYSWYLKLPSKPLLMNYDIISQQNERFLVNKIFPTTASDEYLTFRRNDDKGASNIERYIYNKPLLEAKNSKYAIFFNAKNLDELLKITREVPIKIWYFGKYLGNRYRVCLCTNPIIENYLDPSQILVRKENNSLGQMEIDLNLKVFVKSQDTLKKFTDTPYVENGRYYQVNYLTNKRIGNNLFSF